MTGFNPPHHEELSFIEGEPALHRAARIGDCAEIRRLVAAGERLDSTFNIASDPGADVRHATPFMVAAGSSDGASVETLRVLLELGADPKVEIEGRSAATFACRDWVRRHQPGGDSERLRFVLQAGCPLPVDPEEANRVLCGTAALGDPERVRVLLDCGLSARGHWDPVKARERQRRIIEHMAQSRASQPDRLAWMPEEVRASIAKSMKKTDEEMFEQESSAPWCYDLPLFCAAESGSADCVRVLLDAGADPKARDSSKCTAMYYAGSAAVVETLMRAGLPVEDADEHDWSPLDRAITGGESALPRIRALIEAGANVNATHDRGYTVFMSAVGSGRHPDVLRLLIASGANPHAVTELGYNAFHAAIDVDFGARAEQSVRNTLGYLMELGVNIEHRDTNDQTPLGRALREGTGIEVRVLCELGADPNAMVPSCLCDGDACTRIDLPLLCDAASGTLVDKDVKIEALLKAGADPLSKDNEGFTPLMRAVASLCRDAADPAASYRAFFAGLSELRLHGLRENACREEFVAEATLVLRAYVERFAAEIPVPRTCEFSNEWSTKDVASIVSLCAYDGWSHFERRTLNAS